ncbi:MAG: beta-galactosidase BgaS [Candidatus Bathyarchaeia archaeon]
MNFPDKFLWGAASSGFQFEMGDPAGKNIDPNTDWYAWVHDPTLIQKGIVSGDLPENGVNYWELYKQDHALAKKLGLNAYRIGVEWSRIFPSNTFAVEVGVERASDGKIAKVDIDDSAIEKLDEKANKDAVSHYRAVIEDLRDKNLKVFVCLNHFTLPLWIHNPITVHKTKLRMGPKGWVDEKTIIEFTKYTAYMAWKMGDIVDNWITFNEPTVVPEAGYMASHAQFPPALQNFKAFQKVSTHIVIAHARAYDSIKKFDTVKADDDSNSAANVGLIHNVVPIKPFSPEREADVKAAELMDNMHNHFYIAPFCDGWLDENLNSIKEKGEMKNYLAQRLDWIGINYYTRNVVKGKTKILAKIFVGTSTIPEPVYGYGFLCQPNTKSADGLPTSDVGWEIYPQGLLDCLHSMKKYGKPLYITENGIADEKDTHRPKFITEHLKTLEKAINEEKINVHGYFYWALTDNYEWAKGFKPKFGLYAVDPQTKTRKARKSAETYKKIIKGENPNP